MNKKNPRTIFFPENVVVEIRHFGVLFSPRFFFFISFLMLFSSELSNNLLDVDGEKCCIYAFVLRIFALILIFLDYSVFTNILR